MRAPFQTRTIYLRTETQRQTLLTVAANLPLDADNPLEVVIRERKPVRKPEQNAAMWASVLKDIAEQAWVNGRQFSSDVWHEHLKREYLPDPDAPDFEPAHVKDGYRKWDYLPTGDRVLVGSTTQLTVKGFAVYFEQVCAFAVVDLGVQISAGPR